MVGVVVRGGYVCRLKRGVMSSSLLYFKGRGFQWWGRRRGKGKEGGLEVFECSDGL